MWRLVSSRKSDGDSRSDQLFLEQLHYARGRVNAHVRFGYSLAGVTCPRDECYIGKGAVSVVFAQEIPSGVICHIDIHPTVTIKISSHYSQALPLRISDAALLRRYCQLGVVGVRLGRF